MVFTDRIWVSRLEAAEILDCGPTTVDSLIRRGDLRVARPGNRGRKSLLREDVVALRATRREAARRNEEERTRVRLLADAVREDPADGGTWIGTTEAAEILSVTRKRVIQLVNQERIPYRRRPDGVLRFRAEQLAVVARARAERWATQRAASRRHPE